MNIAVFASGRGSNLRAILNAIHQGFLPARVTVVLSNNSNAGALEIARLHQVPAVHLSQIQFPSEDAYVEKMLAVLQQHEVELIALAGYMKKLPLRVIENFRNKILNIHPALLPAFGGKGMYGHYVHEAVIASGANFSGATVHLVDEEYDRGPIVVQQTLPVEKTDTPDTLAAKVLQIEHTLYVEALKAFAEHRVVIKERNVWIHSHN